jgi:mitochondrial fission protein ELM1
MWQDPIVEELHRYREAHAKKFNYDVWAIHEDLKTKQKQYERDGWRVVSSCPAKAPETDSQLATADIIT